MYADVLISIDALRYRVVDMFYKKKKICKIRLLLKNS